MTRKDQICEAGQQYLDSMNEFQRYHTYPREAFIDGANWADSNPQFSKEKFIEKACKWLVMNASDYAISTTDDEDNCVVSLDMVEDFRKAMEE